MSPEQASEKHQLVSTFSDVDSIGAILYACLSGRAPFVADTTVDTIRQVLEKEPVSLRLLNPQVPKDLETVCLKCLQKDPHRRYATASELADDLQRFLDGRPVVARPVSRATKAMRWAQRNPWVASLAMLSVLLLLTGTVVSTFFAIVANQKAADEVRHRLRADLESQSANEAKESMRTELAQEKYARDAAEDALLVSRWNVYKMSLFPMLKSWQDENSGLLRARLRQSIPTGNEPDFRDWEWYLFHHAVSQRRVASTNQHSFHFVAYNHTNRYLAARRLDHLIDILDAKTLESLRTFPGNNQLFFAWHPTRRSLTVLENLGRIVDRDIDTGDEIASWMASTSLFGVSLQWRPDGNRILVGTGQRRLGEQTFSVEVFDPDLPTSRIYLGDFSPRSVARWSPDSKSIAVRCRRAAKTVQIWDIESQTLQMESDPYDDSCSKWNGRLMANRSPSAAMVERWWFLTPLVDKQSSTKMLTPRLSGP